MLLYWLHIYDVRNACRTRVLKLKMEYKSPSEAYPQNESTPTDNVSANDYPEGSGSQDSASSNASQMQLSPPESSPMQQSSSKSTLQEPCCTSTSCSHSIVQ